MSGTNTNKLLLSEVLTVHRELPALLVGAYAASGQRAKAVMPDGQRENVRDALTRMMVDGTFAEAFKGALYAALQEAKLDPYDLPVEDWDEGQVLASGFAGMGDDQLAGLALDPAAIDAIEKTVTVEVFERDLPRGEWILQADERWKPHPKLRRFVEDMIRKEQMGASPSLPSMDPRSTPSSLQRRWSAPNLSGLLVGGGLAAALLLGLYVIRPGPTDPIRNSGERYESYAMLVQPKVSQLRGDKEVKLSVTWERDGYVGFLVHVPGKGLVVRPDSDEQPDRAEKDKATAERTLPPGTDWVMIVCAEQDPSPALREWVKANGAKAVNPAADLVRDVQAFVKGKKLGVSQVQYQAFP